MAKRRHNGFRMRPVHQGVRILVALLFLVTVPLNAFAMSSSGLMAMSIMAPAGMTMSNAGINGTAMNDAKTGSSKMMAADMTAPGKIAITPMQKHGHHNGADVSNCQMMTQCSAALSEPARFDSTGVLLKSELIFPPENSRARVVQPPFHPPIH